MIVGGDLLHLYWRHPWGLLLGLQPLVMALAARLRRRSGARYAEPHLLAWALWREEVRHTRTLRPMLNALAWLLLACAAAGPLHAAHNGKGLAAVRADHSMDVMVVLDVAAEPGAAGPPNALERAHIELLDLIPRLHGERLGLIVYGHRAGLLMPLNRDYHAFRYYLKLARPSLFRGGGADLVDALALARRKLRGVNSSKAVLLVTSGGSAAFSGRLRAALPAAAAALRSAHVPLYVLDTDDHPAGGAGVLRRAARLTGGRFAGGAAGERPWHVLYDEGIRKLPGTTLLSHSSVRPKPVYGWFLLPAVVLLWSLYFPFWRYPRPGAPSVVVLGAVLVAGIVGVPRPAAAAAGNAAQAYAAYRAGRYALAQAIYTQIPGYAGRMGEGASAYRLKAYPYAEKQFTAALLAAATNAQRADALYDFGDSAYRCGDYRVAADAYAGVLRYRRDPKARANLRRAVRKLGGSARPDKYIMAVLALRSRSGSGQSGGGAGTPERRFAKRHKPFVPVLHGTSAADYAAARPVEVGSEKRVAFAHNSAAARQFYRAALKKLELIHDHAEHLQRALLDADASDGASGGAP